jgi:hypothetical protein
MMLFLLNQTAEALPQDLSQDDKDKFSIFMLYVPTTVILALGGYGVLMV